MPCYNVDMIVGNINKITRNNVSFHMTDKRIAVATRLQFLVVEPYNQYYKNKLYSARDMIECGQINSINDLIEHCDGMVIFSRSNPEWFYEKWGKQ